MKVVLASVFAVLALAACGKKEETKPVEAAPVAASAPAAAPASATK